MRLDATKSSEALSGVSLDLVNAHLGIDGWYDDRDTRDDFETACILEDARHVYGWDDSELDRRLLVIGWRRA